MSEKKEKKTGFLSSFFKIKTNTDLDNILLKQDIEKQNKRRFMKKVFVLIGLAFVVFIVGVTLEIMSVYKASKIEIANKKDKQVVELKADNFGIWQTEIEQKMADEKKKADATSARMENKIDATNEFLTKELPNTLKGIVSGVTLKIENLSDVMSKNNESLNSKIDDLSSKTDEKITYLEGKINKNIDEKMTEVDKKIKDLESIKSASVIPASPDGFPSISPKDAALPKPQEQVKKEYVYYKPNIKISQPDVEPEEEQEATNSAFDIPLGIAEAILVNGGDATIANMGNQEDSPVSLSLLTKMSIANGEYTNVENCLLLGNAIGNMNTERANIRLTKISCIFKDKQGNKYKAEGPIKGWVYDETSNLGVGGKLVTKEGKIIRATLPLAAVQTGLDYVTRKATNISVVGGGYGDLTSALGTGGSSAASETVSKMTDIYTKYLDAMTPTINFKGGRKVSILFQGGESLPLLPYDDKNEFNGDTLMDMQGEKYNYNGNEADYE